eukprot:scaffold17102_cov39-Tisochrysis_lutea.AAC.5
MARAFACSQRSRGPPLWTRQGISAGSGYWGLPLADSASPGARLADLGWLPESSVRLTTRRVGGSEYECRLRLWRDLCCNSQPAPTGHRGFGSEADKSLVSCAQGQRP